MHIEYIKNKHIDRREYDTALKRSFNANIFAYSWYLDLVCDDWDLLMEGNYETVCPLPLSKKFGITRVKQPETAPFLGVFSSSHLPGDKIFAFLKSIPYRNINLTLNHLNNINNRPGKKIRRVPVLDLIPPYLKTMERYSDKARELLSKNNGTFVMRSIRTDEYMFFKRSLKKGPTIPNMQLTRIMNYALRYKSAGIYSVYSPLNELIGAVFLMKTNNRLFLTDCIENTEGQQQSAVFRAVNHIIETNSETNLTLEIPLGSASSLNTMIQFDHHHCQKYRKGIL